VLQRVRVQRSRLRGQRILRVPRLSSEGYSSSRCPASGLRNRPVIRGRGQVPKCRWAPEHSLTGGDRRNLRSTLNPMDQRPDEIIIMAEPECRRGMIRSDIRPHASGLGVTTSAARLVQIMAPHPHTGRTRPHFRKVWTRV